MKSEKRFSSAMCAFQNTSDRYVTGGYKEPITMKEMINSTKSIPDLEGVELVEGWNVTNDNLEEIKDLLAEANLKTSMIIPELFTTKKWAKGSLSSNDPKIREDAKQVIRNAVDMAKKLDCDMIDIWLGQDGWDYCFTQDYIKAWDRIVEGLTEVADYDKSVKIAIEYKIKEPRVNMHVGTVGKVLLLLQEVNRENFGAVLDLGHALAAYENCAQSIALLKRFGDKLFHVHFNDNYRLWDDDLMACSVHTIEYIELLYWLEKTNYNGWYSLDVFPYREDGVKVAKESFEWIKALIGVVKKMGMSKIEEVIAMDDATEAMALIRKALFSTSNGGLL